MKTKTSSFGKAFLSKKRFVENSICAVLAVFSGYFACGSNYKLRIGNYEVTASENDYVLGVYGNANEIHIPTWGCFLFFEETDIINERDIEK